MLTERVLENPSRLRVSQEPPVAGPRAAPSTSYRWIAEDIKSRWRKKTEKGYTTFTSPRVEIASMDRFDSIVIDLARAPAAGTFSLLWSHDESPSAADFLRNRREIAVYGDVPRRAFVLRGHDIAPAAIGRGDEEARPVHFFFLRFPTNDDAEAVIDSVSLLSRADALAGRPLGLVRYSARGQSRSALYANGPLRLDFETSVADGSELLFGVQAVSQSTLRVQLTAGVGRTLLTRSLAGAATWQDLRVRLPRSRGGVPTRLSLSVASSRANDTVLVSDPTIVVPKAARRYPNVILYVIDSLRADRLGVYGYGAGTSPFLDSLARRGTLVRNCQAQAAWTKPSIASLLTSLQPQTHGVGARSSFDELPASVPTLPGLLRSHGYLTAQFTANAFASTLSGLDRGFDEVFSPEAFGTASKTAKVRSDDINALLLPWIEAHARDRFFAYVHSIDPHPPFAATGRSEGSDAYDDAIRFNDIQLRLLYERLEALGLLDDTLFVVTADHGEAFGEHGRSGHGQSVHREEMHIPLLFFRPRALRASVVEAPVESLDVMPTILDHCGVGFDKTLLQGKSLGSATKAALASRTVFSTRYVYPDAAELPEFFGREQYAASQGRYKLIATRQPEQTDLALELYDVDADPFERADLKAGQPETVASLSAALRSFLEEQRTSRSLFLARHGEALGFGPGAGARVPQDTLDRLKSLGYLK